MKGTSEVKLHFKKQEKMPVPVKKAAPNITNPFDYLHYSHAAINSSIAGESDTHSSNLRASKKTHHGKKQAEPDPPPEGFLPFDGQFLMGCFEDNSPKESRLFYDVLVPKEDSEPMSSTVCYEFCRSKPGMLFFATYEGRKCYCAPYFDLNAGTGGEGQCEQVCEGRPTEMCGGMAKISAYEMHRCGDTAEDAQKAIEDFEAEDKKCTEWYEEGTALLKGMDVTADAIDVGEVRHGIQEAARGVNEKTSHVKNRMDDAFKAKGELAKVVKEVKLDNLEGIRKVEAAIRTLKEEQKKYETVCDELDEYLEAASMSRKMKKLNIDPNKMRELGMKGLPPDPIHRMPNSVRDKIGCDKKVKDGCDDFDLMYWVEGVNMKIISEIYDVSAESDPMKPEPWKIAFLWKCVDLCQRTEGCVAADVYGQVGENVPVWSANCAMKSKIHSVFMGKVSGKFGFTLDTGFIFEQYFQMAKDEIQWTIA